MKTVTATEVKNKWGQILLAAIREPVIVEKNNHPVAVVLSIDEHTRLVELEDKYWAMLAEEAEREGYLSREDSMNILKKHMEIAE